MQFLQWYQPGPLHWPLGMWCFIVTISRLYTFFRLAQVVVNISCLCCVICSMFALTTTFYYARFTSLVCRTVLLTVFLVYRCPSSTASAQQPANIPRSYHMFLWPTSSKCSGVLSLWPRGLYSSNLHRSSTTVSQLLWHVRPEPLAGIRGHAHLVCYASCSAHKTSIH